MTTLFVDTSYYVALVNPRDTLHARAMELAGRFAVPFMTTESVLIETANFLAKSDVRGVFVRLMSELGADPQTTILASTNERFSEGLALFASRPDKDWSLTHCISFVVMRQHGLTESLTHDHHFEQAGFKACLR
jgi:uncharacterized protein